MLNYTQFSGCQASIFNPRFTTVLHKGPLYGESKIRPWRSARPDGDIPL